MLARSCRYQYNGQRRKVNPLPKRQPDFAIRFMEIRCEADQARMRRRRISEAFWPPNPKLFVMAVSTFRSRATFGT